MRAWKKRRYTTPLRTGRASSRPIAFPEHEKVAFRSSQRTHGSTLIASLPPGRDGIDSPPVRRNDRKIIHRDTRQEVGSDPIHARHRSPSAGRAAADPGHRRAPRPSRDRLPGLSGVDQKPRRRRAAWLRRPTCGLAAVSVSFGTACRPRVGCAGSPVTPAWTTFLARFDGNGFARRVRRAAAAAKAPSRRRLAPMARYVAVGAAAALLVAMVMVARGYPPNHPAARCAGGHRRLGAVCVLRLPRPTGPRRIGARVSDGRRARKRDLEWALQSLVYRARRACAACTVREGEVATAMVARRRRARPDPSGTRVVAGDLRQLAGRLDSLARTDTLLRALAPPR